MKKLTKSQEKDIKAMFTIFKNKYRGKDSFKLYTKNIREFFRITMDVYVLETVKYLKTVVSGLKKVNGKDQMRFNIGLNYVK